MPQLLRGRQFEPHCQPMLYLTVTVNISQQCETVTTYMLFFSFLQRFQTKDARICTELHREFPERMVAYAALHTAFADAFEVSAVSP